MSRPQSRWWRAYDAALENPKVQRLSDKMFRTWFNVLCIACRHGGELPSVDDVAFLLRVRVDEAERRLSELQSAGLIDCLNGRMKPHDWDAMQFHSDVSTERVKRFRKRERNVSETPDETPPETETETDTEINPSLRSGSSTPTNGADRGAAVDLGKVKRKPPEDEEQIQAICELWNAAAAAMGLAQIRDIPDARVARIRARGRDLVGTYGQPDMVTGFGVVITKIRGSPLLRGEKGRGWKASFDWVTKAENFTKIMEDTYAVQGSNGFAGRH